MGFNWKAFAASFLEKQTEGIRERRAEAKEFEEEQEELAERNRKLLRDRTLLANDAAQMAQKAMELGATRDQVIAAMGSGALGMKTFYDKLLKAANQKGIPTLGAADVEAIIDMPEVFEVNPDYVDMNLGQLAKIQYGAMLDPNMKAEEVQTSDSVLAKLFGVDAMNQARKKLQDTKFVGGMSIADVNELSAQADYDSLFPNLGVNFFDKEFYGPTRASEFLKNMTDIQMEAVSGTAAKQYIEDAGRIHLQKMSPASEFYDETYASENQGVTPMEVKEAAKDFLIQTQARNIIRGVVDEYGQTGLFDHEPSVNIIKKIMGEQYVSDELELLKTFNKQDDDSVDSVPTSESTAAANEQAANLMKQTPTERDEDQEENPMDLQEPQAPETQTSDSETEKTTLSPEETDDEFVPIPRPESKGVIIDAIDAGGVGAWDKKYKGKLDPVTGEKIIVEARPPAGGPKNKEVEARTSTGTRVPGKTRKVTAREEWDMLYGKTHNPDGSPDL